jgi:tetratricopeptide (TPR) repeat protein
MEYLQGSDLRLYSERLRRLPPSERHQRVREIAVALCETLAQLHRQGLIHRDLKPANVIIDTTGRVVLTDFGIACEEGSEVTAAGILIGTAAYAAPEQLSGSGIDARVDQYGLGGTLYFLLTGQRPFEKTDVAAMVRAHLESDPRPPSELDPTIPADLDTFVMRLLSRDPLARFRSVKEAREALVGALPSEVPLAGRQPVVDAIAAALDRVAAGETVRIHLKGPVGAGKKWARSLARTAASRLGLRALEPRDPLVPPALVLSDEPFQAAEALFLPPLSLAELRRSVHAFAPDTVEMAAVAERLHRETGGNPGLFVQLLRRYTSDGATVLPADTLEVDPTRWLHNLDMDGEVVAGVLALLTEAADTETLTELAQVPADLVLPDLEERFIALRTEGGWVIGADVLRAPLRALLADPEGLEERIRGMNSRRRGPPAEDLLLEEVRQLRAQNRVGEAVHLLEEGLSGRGDLPAGRLLALGSIAWNQGNAAAAWTYYARALGMAEHPLYKARGHIGIGISALQVGHVEAALDHFERGRVEASVAEDTRREVIALLNLAEARCWVGQLALALAAARRAVGLADGIKDRELECSALRHLGQVLIELGMPTEAGRHLADASALAKALGLEEERLAVHVLRAWAALLERPGDRTAAAAALDRLSPLLSSPPPAADPEGFWLQLQGVRAWAAAILGDNRGYARARTEADTSKAGMRVTVRLRGELLLAEAARMAGEEEDARRRAQSAATEARLRGFRLLLWEAERLLARLDGRPLPPPSELAVGRGPVEAEAFSRR